MKSMLSGKKKLKIVYHFRRRKMTIGAYKDYCLNIGKTDGSYTVKEFLNDIDNGDLVKCSVCGEYNKEEHMTRARFDYNEVVCPDCRRDGN